MIALTPLKVNAFRHFPASPAQLLSGTVSGEKNSGFPALPAQLFPRSTLTPGAHFLPVVWYNTSPAPLAKTSGDNPRH
jgi:hypothetical protein